MIPKKNPKADPKRNSILFFQLGLVVILLLSYITIEIKTYEKQIVALETTFDPNLPEEIVPITQQNYKTPPPPPPPPSPIIIQVVDNEKKIVEPDMQASDVILDQKIVKAAKIAVFKEVEDIEIPFPIIEDVPIFPGCEKVAKENRRACLQEQIQKHIRKNFRYPEAAIDANIQGRVYVSFVIGKDGNVSIANLRGPDKSLEKEAERIMSKLPKMTPGKQRGEPVRMTMSIPITFELNQ